MIKYTKSGSSLTVEWAHGVRPARVQFPAPRLIFSSIMKIYEIYEKYKVMPQLQLHMLRVTGFALLVCDNFEKPIDKDSIISALLVHDIGNVIKFKFNLKIFPESWFAPLGKKYWMIVQKEFIAKYGRNDYQATYKILEELHTPDNIVEIVRSMEFSKANEISKRNNLKSKICLYSDARVAPFGVTSAKERLEEVRERYIRNKGVDERYFNSLVESMFKIEKQIFTHCKIKPENITEEKVKPLIEKLKNFEIITR